MHFGNAAVYSNVLDAWLSADGRRLDISDDRAKTRPWATFEEGALEEAERSKAEAERTLAAFERERKLREALESKLRELTAERPPR